MIRFVAPAFNMSLDPNQEKFRKHWSEQQLIASQERRREGRDPNNERARAGQKADIIIDLPTGPALEGFICEVSGGLSAGCPKKIWTDKLKLMVGMRDIINRVMKTFLNGLYESYCIRMPSDRFADESICNGCPDSRNLSFWNSRQDFFACFGKRITYI